MSRNNHLNLPKGTSFFKVCRTILLCCSGGGFCFSQMITAFFVILLVSSCNHSQNCSCHNSSLRPETSNALSHLDTPLALDVWDDYYSAQNCADSCGKPLLILFTSVCCHSVTPPHEIILLQDSLALETINKSYVFTVLFTDDNTKLPQSGNASKNMDGFETYCDMWTDLELKLTGENGPPKYVILIEGNVKDVYSISDENGDVIKFRNYLLKYT